MQLDTKEFSAFSDIKEYAAILLIKILIAVLMFAFSAALIELAGKYLNSADGWIRNRSQAVSRNILDLYR